MKHGLDTIKKMAQKKDLQISADISEPQNTAFLAFLNATLDCYILTALASWMTNILVLSSYTFMSASSLYY